MPYFFYYLLKVTICSAVLYGYYYFFLRNKVYHAYNRFYLLATVFISLLCPFINFNIFFAADSAEATPIQLLQVVTNGNAYLEELMLQTRQPRISTAQVLSGLYCIVSLVLLAMLLKLLANIFAILRTTAARKLNDITFIQTDTPNTPFSFFRFIFWNPAIDINSPTGQQIFAHEVAHVKEQHSADKLFLTLTLIFCWINPVFWMIKKELNLIHEFIADKKAVTNNDAEALAAMIVTSAYPKHSYLLTNHFFYSPIKRRILMLSKYNTNKAGYFYRVLALPVVLFLVAAITIKAKSSFDEIVNPDKKITVVIDAGHGGQDAGGRSPDGSILEKDCNLAFAKSIKAHNQSPNIHIILTRENDIYQTPQEKAIFAKKAGADLFISVHAGSRTSSWTTDNGLEVFVAKDEHANSNSSKLFASAIISNFKNNYGIQVPSNPSQRKVGIYVLQANEFPSVLIELGYISNKKDLAYLKSEEAKQAFAKNILASIAQYAANVNNHSKQAAASAIADTLPAGNYNLGYYKGEKIENISVKKKTGMVEIKLANGKLVNMTMEEAKKENLLLPPPPPPAAPVPPVPPVPAVAPVPPVPPVPPMPAVAPVPPIPPKPPVKNKNNSSNSNIDVKVNTNNFTVNTNNSTHVSGETNVTFKNCPEELQPLVILDGIEITYPEMQKLDPNKIQSINVLKGEQALKKYNVKKSVNGVIEITTKLNVIITKSDSKTNVETNVNQK